VGGNAPTSENHLFTVTNIDPMNLNAFGQIFHHIVAKSFLCKWAWIGFLTNHEVGSGDNVSQI